MNNNQDNNYYDSFDLGPCCEEYEDVRPTGTVWVDDKLIDKAAQTLAAFMANERQTVLMPYEVRESLANWLESHIEGLLTDAANDATWPFLLTGGRDFVDGLESEISRRRRRAYEAIELAEETF